MENAREVIVVQLGTQRPGDLMVAGPPHASPGVDTRACSIERTEGVTCSTNRLWIPPEGSFPP